MDKKSSVVCDRIKLNKVEKQLLAQLLSMFKETGDDSFSETMNNPQAKKAFMNLSEVCGYRSEIGFDSKTVSNLLKKIGN